MTFDPDIHRRRSIRLEGHDYSRPGLYFVTICVQSRLCLLGSIVDNQSLLNSAGNMIDRWWNKLSLKFTNVQLDKYIVMPNHFHGIIEIKNPAGPDQRNQCENTYQIEGEYAIEKQTEHDQDKEGAHMGAPLHVGVDPRVYPDSPYSPLPQHPVVPYRRGRPANAGRTHGSAPTVGVDPRVYPLIPRSFLPSSPSACLPNYPDACLPSQSHEQNQTWADTWVRPYDTGKPARLHKMMQWFKTMTTNEYIRNERLNGWQAFDRKLWQRNYYEHITRDDESLNKIREYIVNNPKNWKDDEMFPGITGTLLDKYDQNGTETP